MGVRKVNDMTTTFGWVRLQLDVTGFDETTLIPLLERLTAEGVRFPTMADLGDSNQARRRLYELYCACTNGVPGVASFDSFAEYVDARIDTASYDPEGVVVAVQRGRWVGMSATTLNPEEGHAFSEMTGVVPDERGRGIGPAMKLLAVRYVRAHDYRWLRTFHHRENTAVIRMNRRIGFTDV